MPLYMLLRYNAVSSKSDDTEVRPILSALGLETPTRKHCDG